MKRIIYWFLIATLHVMGWVFTAARPFAQHQGRSHISQSPEAALDSKQGSVEGIGQTNWDKEDMTYKGVSRLGSRPPNCEYRCGLCSPCIAIQVPTNTDQIQYANYKPEGWKCKCGSTFFDP